MEVSAWSNGGGTYGIRVGFRNRTQFFDREWTEIEVDLDGEISRVPLSVGFWNRCPEFRSPIIREWLRRQNALEWPKREPPKFELIPLGGNRFRLVS